ncbi:MAG: Rrf2 family transcriptional regulator [Clostridiales bacterium]|nr:Rrf2 family transcriptional regulator [Clostridiales bacterium]
MKVSTRGRYALRLMVELAKREQDTPVSLKKISIGQEISYKYLEQIVKSLTGAGILRSVRGAQGGYLLNVSPEQITVGEILRVTEGSLTPVSCLNDTETPEEEDCNRQEKCEVYDFWKGLQDVVSEYIDSVTLHDMIK